MSSVLIITGGTINKSAPHLAVSAPAYGSVGESLCKVFDTVGFKDYTLIKTKMADSSFHHSSFELAEISSIETNQDLVNYVLKYVNQDSSIRAVVLAVAVADFDIKNAMGNNIDHRLSSGTDHFVRLVPSQKVLPLLRPNLYVVSFKTLYKELHNTEKALKNLDQSDLVFVNDIGYRVNGIGTDQGVTWLDSRSETIKATAYSILNNLELLNAQCSRCGNNQSVNWDVFFNSTCECGNRKRSIMSYRTIVKYKYGITCKNTL